MRYYLNSGLFIAIILLFLLPFLEIRCNGVELGYMTGYDLATNGELRVKDSSLNEYMQGPEIESMKEKKGVDPFTVVTASLLLLGALSQVIRKPKVREWLAISLSLLVMAVLGLMQIVYLKEWENRMPQLGEMFASLKITLNFSYGYWIVLISPLAIIQINLINLFESNRNRRWKRNNRPIIIEGPDVVPDPIT